MAKGASSTKRSRAAAAEAKPNAARTAARPKAAAKAKPKAAAKSTAGAGEPASKRIDRRIREIGGWRGETLARMRALILEADPAMIEEVKWVKPTNPAGVPVWSHGGIVCTGETYKSYVKLTFARGASLPDPAGLFNASLEGNARRAIDLREGEAVDARAFKALVKAAVAANLGKAGGAAKPAKSTKRASDEVVLLSGGNPQIAKGDGDAPVQAYVAALSGWKRDVCQRIDALVVRTVPGVKKAVKWNSPFYGVEGQGWFLSFHVFNRYVKATFFAGAHLDPPLPGGTQKDARWIDLHEGELDEAELVRWIEQAAARPGWIP